MTQLYIGLGMAIGGAIMMAYGITAILEQYKKEVLDQCKNKE